MTRFKGVLFSVAAAGLSVGGAAMAQQTLPAFVAPALADPGRPAGDVARDADRKAGELVAFAGIKPGDKVIDFIPGGGYFTRVFSGVVGPTGHVYAMIPASAVELEAKETATIAPFAANHPNVSIITPPAPKFFSPDGPVDVFWTSQNYHDLFNPFGAQKDKAKDMVGLDKVIFAALKPGGTFIVIDHVAPAGSGVADTDTLHRIDPAVVRRDVEAAGFKFEGESEVLRNPADPHTKVVFDPSIRGHTDQFVYKFRKPAA